MAVTTLALGALFVILSGYGLWVGFTASGEYLQSHLSYRAMIPFRALGVDDNLTLVRVTWILSTGFVGVIGVGLLALSVV
ncbi:hypothetical protein [Halobaculum marinum]|uniref:Uncharacterized protein n=1 Tax=Halobaculum marinum TaxID=3031996 RepID=A0ABD5WXC2_9EURY|nr:hypothetical protein [Halobaculum sp. DT55]